MESIIDSGYNHTKRVCKNFEIKNLGDYNNLEFKNDTLFLAVFENFRKMYHLDPAKFI